jgi:Retroviral aspartyl protease
MGDDSPVSLDDEVEEPSGEAPENDNDADDEDEERLVEDPYDPQTLSLLESEHEGGDDAEERSFSFNPLSFVSVDEDNYVLKLASARKQEELLSEEQIVAELVDDPVRHLKTDGELPPKKGAVVGTSSAGKAPAKLTKKSPPMFDAKLRLSREAGKYPSDRSVELRRTLVSTVEINGTNALVMFDSGAETDALSPDFVRACHIPLLELPSPLVLQMGTKGSRSCIYYGTNVDLKVLGDKSKHYFDVVNIDRYDAILGAPWLNAYGVVLDFKNHVVTVGGVSLPTLDALKERSTVATGASARRQHYGVAARSKGASQTSQR